MTKSTKNNFNFWLTPEIVKKEVSKHFGVNISTMNFAKGTRYNKMARDFAVLLMSDLLYMSSTEIGEQFRTTSRHSIQDSVNRTNSIIQENSTAHEVYKYLRDKLINYRGTNYAEEHSN